MAQIPNRFHPDRQQKYKIQYFAPVEDNYFAGDPIPFFHDGTFHVFYLLDSAHHALNMGGHQWAHCASKDLVHWTHYPLAVRLSLETGETCGTGSVVYKDGTYYLYYTTRVAGIPDKKEYVSLATGTDGIHYLKPPFKPYLDIPSDRYSPRNYRDPHVFYDTKSKTYYMLVTATLADFQFIQQEARQVYYTSKDLKTWDFKGDFYTSGDDVGFAIAECPTLFEWNGWYYLMYKVTGGSYYRMSKSVTGPWMAPVEDNIGNDFALVHKVETYQENRRIAVGMVPSRTGNKDDGGWAYAGNLVFRELFQNGDGTLYSGQVKEMMPDRSTSIKPEDIQINAENGFSANDIKQIPVNAVISFEVNPDNDYEQAGVMLRFKDKKYYNLKFSHRQRLVSLGNQSIYGVYDLDKPFKVTIVMKNDIIDMCIDGKRCLLNRCPEIKGTEMVFYVRNGKVSFKNIVVEEIKEGADEGKN